MWTAVCGLISQRETAQRGTRERVENARRNAPVRAVELALWLVARHERDRADVSEAALEVPGHTRQRSFFTHCLSGGW